MAVVNGINTQQNVGVINSGRFTPQQNVGDINKATRVTGQSQDNLVDLATSQTRYEDHQNDMFAHQRHIARQAYIEYGRQGAAEQATEPVITTATDITDTSAAQSYRAITGEDPSTSGQARQATAQQGAEPDATPQSTEPVAAEPEVGTTNQAEGETKESQSNSAQQRDKGIDGEELTEEEQAEVEDMKDRDAEVRTHENAHKSAGGQYAAAPSYTYETGPDGKRYITDGEVSIDIGEESDPQDTITKMQVVKRAALAPAQPSAQDRQVYAEASQKEAQARQELNEQKQEEALKKKHQSKSLQAAMKKLNKAEEVYARVIIQFSNKTRLKLYRKIASLMKNRFSLMDALEMLHDGASNGGKNPGEPLAIAIAAWGRALNNGMTFSDALKGWAPDRERLMLSVGDVSDLESALLNLIKVTEGSTKMIRPIIGAISYPSFLLMMAVLIIYAIGVYMVPPMIDAAPNVRWRGLAKNLVDLSGWIKDNWLIAFSALPIIMGVIYFTISIWTGKIRAVFDNIPPWSLYKVFIGITWLLALSALVKGGVPVSTALQSLRRDSNAYLKERIDKTLAFIKNGDNLGQALMKTGLNFPDKEIIADLKIYSELDNFEEALEKLADDWLEESVYMIEQKASLLNMAALLAVAGVIAWAVFGVFEMQDQITSAMGG